jgi:hypothetical protein
MKSSNWKAVVESIGILAIVASLIFVGLQIQQERRVASSQVNMATLETIVAIEMAMSEHADVWVKARDMQNLSDAETQIVRNLIHMARAKAFFEASASQRVRSGDSIDFEKSRGPIMGFAILLHENAGARKVWAEKVARDEKYYEKTGNLDITHFNNVVRDYLLLLQN